jgi:hypothetical protein
MVVAAAAVILQYNNVLSPLQLFTNTRREQRLMHYYHPTAKTLLLKRSPLFVRQEFSTGILYCNLHAL